jgi:peptide/nickel transport system permease protein
MGGYLAQRLWQLPAVLLVVTGLVFSVMHLVPGDPAQLLLGFENTDPVQLERVRRELGLDRPIPVQYALWLARVLRGDLGVSARTGRPVAETVAEALPYTMTLALYGLALALLLAVPLGVWAGTTRSRAVDALAQSVLFAALSMPAFWLGSVLILVFAVELRWFPLLTYPHPWRDPLGSLRGFLLPAVTLAIPNGAAIARMVRASVLAVRGEEYVRVARAKGLREVAVIRRHVVPNALVPVVTLVGIVAGYLLGGSVVVEQVFAVPGLGRAGLQAIVQRDYPVLQGVVLVTTAAFVLVNLAVDVLYAVLDPRIRYG